MFHFNAAVNSRPYLSGMRILQFSLAPNVKMRAATCWAITILAVLYTTPLALTEHPAAQLVVPAGQFCVQQNRAHTGEAGQNK
jgi:hypothetical protein